MKWMCWDCRGFSETIMVGVVGLQRIYRNDNDGCAGTAEDLSER